ncbi:hypothetical protein N7510_004719 [Penicillium lagena]|uniref:uncharacterized protein n=1 Tax=Penicillium lagena TaxID=94218 RepID=UPI00253FCA19|nr:uncharacterized protein N7510_004719 [Penicillium lagena]KAJ5620735.1 hypothetical protein N7510_004719 [Penicillium lagena]
MASSRDGLFQVLVINPNTSSRMTDALRPILARLNYADVHFDYYTAPDHPVEVNGRTYDPIPSINSGEDSAKSAWHCHSTLGLVEQYDAFLVACYSAHPLVGMLKQKIKQSSEKKYVTGIFEASITASLSLISAFDFDHPAELHKSQIKETFGIITTGSAWKDELSNAVTDMLGSSSSSRFAGVETTGLTAIELHTTPADEVRRRICDATQRLIQNAPHPVRAICLGCAGMAGMEEAVREGCVMAYGEEGGQMVRIVDGVVAGAGTLVTACKAGF